MKPTVALVNLSLWLQSVAALRLVTECACRACAVWSSCRPWFPQRGGRLRRAALEAARERRMDKERTTAGAWRGRLWALSVPWVVLLWSRPVASWTYPPVSSTPCISFTGRTCAECIQNTTCLWCSENSTCMDYPTSKLLPPSSVCRLSEANWAVCWFNLEAILITLGVVAGVLLLLIVACCCCCCGRYRCYCRKSRAMGRLVEEEEEKFIRDREEKRLQSLQRKHERKVKHDEIRKKYGLLQDSDHPYSRYENE